MGRKNAPLIITLCVIAGFFHYLLQLGFVSDDAYGVQIKGHLITHGITLVDYWLDTISHTFSNLDSRYNITCLFYCNGLFSLTQNSLIYHSINLTTLVFSAFLFYVFIKNESENSKFALLVIILLPLIIQIRPWHDPIVAFQFQFQVMFIFIISSLIFFQRYLEYKKIKNLFLSFISYTLACFTYEIAYFMFPLFLIIAYKKSNQIKEVLFFSLPLIFISFAFILRKVLGKILIFYDELIASISPDHLPTVPGAFDATWRTTPNFTSDFISAFLVQVTSSFPFIFQFTHWEFKFHYHYYDILFLILTPIFIYYFSKYIFLKRVNEKINFNGLLPIAIFIWLMPAAITALSGHQQELKDAGFGFGYLPVYLQYFGTALFFGVLIFRFANFSIIQNNIKVFTLIFTIPFLINYLSNQTYALDSKGPYKYPRELLLSANQKGLFNEISTNDLIFRAHYYPSDHMSNYALMLNKRVNLCDVIWPEIYKQDTSEYSKCFKESFTPGGNFIVEQRGNLTYFFPKRNVWYLFYEFEAKGRSGNVYLAKIDEFIIDNMNNQVMAVNVNAINIFNLNENEIKLLSHSNNNKIDIFKMNSFRNFVYKEKDIKFDFFKNSNIDIYEASEDLFTSWSNGTHALEGTAESNHRWASGTAKLSIYNASNVSQSAYFSFVLRSPTGRDSIIKVGKHEYELKSNADLKIEKFIEIDANSSYELDISSNDYPIENGDPRNIVFGVFNYEQKIKEIERNKAPISYHFGNGWHADEVTHRWSKQKEASIIINNNLNKEIFRKINFNISTLGSLDLKIFLNNNLINQSKLLKNKKKFYQFEINLKKGKNSIKLVSSDEPKKGSRKTDSRVLGISISNIKIFK